MPATVSSTPLLARTFHATPEALVIDLGDREVTVSWEKCSPRLATASPAERQCAELSPSGCGIHWPLLDEDLAIGPLVWAVSQHGRGQ